MAILKVQLLTNMDHHPNFLDRLRMAHPIRYTYFSANGFPKLRSRVPSTFHRWLTSLQNGDAASCHVGVTSRDPKATSLDPSDGSEPQLRPPSIGPTLQLPPLEGEPPGSPTSAHLSSNQASGCLSGCPPVNEQKP